MARTLTGRPVNHPHNAFKSHQQWLFEELRKLGTLEFTAVFDSTFQKVLDLARTTEDYPVPTGIPEGRKARTEWLLSIDAFNYKRNWNLKYGWQFDDIYDDAKFEKHVIRAQMEAERMKREAA